MAEFKSYRSYIKFGWTVKKSNRYIHPPEVEEFLECVWETSEKRRRTVPQESYLWRAQLGNDWIECKQDENIWEEPTPYSQERMKPDAPHACEGRLNPKGIPFLYLSTDRETAMAEVRPAVGSLVSVGQFKTLRPLQVVDCSVSHNRGPFLCLEEPEPEKREESVWADIDRSFSEPVSPSDVVADYVATQIIAELFKDKGMDGIYYKSLLGKEDNLALFDLNSAVSVNCSLYRAKTVEFQFEKYPGQHSVRIFPDTVGQANS